MVHGSLALLSTTLPSSSSNYSPLANPDWPSSSSSRLFSVFIRNSGLRNFKLRASFKQQQSKLVEADNGSAEHFLENNSIADFMRFIKRSSNSKSSDDAEGGSYRSSELQTAVVSYRKKFPWSLLQPFLQVSIFSFYFSFSEQRCQLFAFVSYLGFRIALIVCEDFNLEFVLTTSLC